MRRIRRSLGWVTDSRLARKKSLTSAWRRSMSSTRRTLRRPRTACRKHVAVVVAEAAVAEAAVAEAAGVAEAAAAVVAVAVAAVCLGALAASAKPDHFPITLADTLIIGRVRHGRPGQSMFSLQCGPHTRSGAAAHDGRMGLQPCRKKQAREPEQRTPLVGKHTLQKRAEAASKV
jgi:hypothetical protein